jgi:hypothetical protein
LGLIVDGWTNRFSEEITDFHLCILLWFLTANSKNQGLILEILLYMSEVLLKLTCDVEAAVSQQVANNHKVVYKIVILICMFQVDRVLLPNGNTCYFA